jgi:hypothetical protein
LVARRGDRWWIVARIVLAIVFGRARNAAPSFRAK